MKKSTIFVHTSCSESFAQEVRTILSMFYTIVPMREERWGDIDRVVYDADAFVIIGSPSEQFMMELAKRQEISAPICYIACPCSSASEGVQLGQFPSERGYKKLLKVVDAALRGEPHRSSVTHSKARP